MTWTLALERALRAAATWHRRQERRGSGVPYVEHVVAVAMILDRQGFPEDVVIAGLLHDAVEDTETTLDQVRVAFGDRVAAWVDACSEVKLDDLGRKRPWLDRKRDHLEVAGEGSVEVRAILLADKLHNLLSIQLDLEEGRPVWAGFHADRDQVLWYYREAIRRCDRGDDPRLGALARLAREALLTVEAAVSTGPISEAPGVPH